MIWCLLKQGKFPYTAESTLISWECEILGYGPSMCLSTDNPTLLRNHLSHPPVLHVPKSWRSHMESTTDSAKQHYRKTVPLHGYLLFPKERSIFQTVWDSIRIRYGALPLCLHTFMREVLCLHDTRCSLRLWCYMNLFLTFKYMSLSFCFHTQFGKHSCLPECFSWKCSFSTVLLLRDMSMSLSLGNHTLLESASIFGKDVRWTSFLIHAVL